MDTEIRCFIELKDYNGAKEVQPRVQLEAVRLIKERGFSVAQASRDFKVH